MDMELVKFDNLMVVWCGTCVFETNSWLQIVAHILVDLLVDALMAYRLMSCGIFSLGYEEMYLRKLWKPRNKDWETQEQSFGNLETHLWKYWKLRNKVLETKFWKQSFGNQVTKLWKTGDKDLETKQQSFENQGRKSWKLRY